MPDKWILCPTCKQMVLRDKRNAHKCPAGVLVKKEIEIEEVVEDETLFLDDQIDLFWRDPKTMWLQYQLDREKGEWIE